MKYCNKNKIDKKSLEIMLKIMQTMKYCNCHGNNCNKDWDAAAAPASSGSEVRFLICWVWNSSQQHEQYEFCKIF